MRGPGVDPMASESKASGRGSEDRFVEVLLPPCHNRFRQITASHLRTLVELIRSHTSALIVVSWQMHP